MLSSFLGIDPTFLCWDVNVLLLFTALDVPLGLPSLGFYRNEKNDTHQNHVRLFVPSHISFGIFQPP